MHTSHLPRVILCVCAVMLPLSAGAQTTSDTTSQSKSASPTSAPNRTPSIGGAGPASHGATRKHDKHQKQKKHHAVSHNRSHSHGATMAVASPASSGETNYRAALRKCVAGPKARRDSCLNDAISQFGHP